MVYVVPFRELDLGRVSEAGGKNASLGELLRELSPKGIPVPDGFAIAASAFRLHLEASKLDHLIYSWLDDLDVEDVGKLKRVGAAIRDAIRAAPLPAEVASEVLAAYQGLSSTFGETTTDVAVRSSATAEDLPSASFAGQQETYLNVRGSARLLEAVRDCMASLFTDRAIVYRTERGFDHRQVALSVGVQKMVRSDLGAAGVIFTLDTESGFRDAVIVTAAWGLGESVVQGRVNPDEYWVHKPTLEQGSAPIVRRQVGDKAITLVYSPDETSVVEQPVSSERRRTLALSDEEVLKLARWAVSIERHYSERAGQPTPMDIEWAKDGRSGQLFILQARP
jgi:pyruvate,water dikinase